MIDVEPAKEPTVPEEDPSAALKQVAASGPVTAKGIRAAAAGKVIDVEPEPTEQVVKHCPTCTCV